TLPQARATTVNKESTKEYPNTGNYNANSTFSSNIPGSAMWTVSNDVPSPADPIPISNTGDLVVP
ncbi:hypothetical protein BaRGS_00021173, partial [Batillaria attramentaria]